MMATPSVAEMPLVYVPRQQEMYLGGLDRDFLTVSLPELAYRNNTAQNFKYALLL